MKDSITAHSASKSDEKLLLKDAPHACAKCARQFCLRQQVINLSLGYADTMLCLDCLGAELGQTAPDLITRMKPYILSRDCFLREWKKYQTVEACPDPLGCHPHRCFSTP